MKNALKIFLIIIICSSFAFNGNAQDSNKIKELEERINSLEKRQSSLEKMFYQNQAQLKNNDSLVTKQKVKAMKRVKQDQDKFSAEDLKAAEDLYVKGSDKMKTEEGKKYLEELIAKYPLTNRAGCAAMYIAQIKEDSQQEKFLKDVIEKYNDCFYLDGVQTGPYAHFYLARYYNEKGDKKSFEEQLKLLNEKYPDAIDHQGKKLSDFVW
ncbi:MAG: hypothetical protein ABI840_11930 [bacterium]